MELENLAITGSSSSSRLLGLPGIPQSYPSTTLVASGFFKKFASKAQIYPRQPIFAL